MGALARRLGFTQVSLSSEVMPMVRAVPRGYTVCADAYLTPKIHQYLKGFTSGFKGGLKVCFSHQYVCSSLLLCYYKIPHFLSCALILLKSCEWVTHGLHLTDHRQDFPDDPSSWGSIQEPVSSQHWNDLLHLLFPSVFFRMWMSCSCSQMAV